MITSGTASGARGVRATAATAITVLPRSGIATMLAVGVVLQGLTYLAAPAMAVVAERDLRRQLAREPLHGWGESVSPPQGLEVGLDAACVQSGPTPGTACPPLEPRDESAVILNTAAH